MTKIEGITVAEVNEFATKVTEDWNRDCQGEASEDYSDAFHSIGELYRYISAEMLYEIYKEDKDEGTKKYMENMRENARTEAQEALESLGAFGITRTPAIDQI